jgi:hypothetical protein
MKQRIFFMDDFMMRWLVVLVLTVCYTQAFVSPTHYRIRSSRSSLLSASPPQSTTEERRRELLTRKGPHFRLDRSSGRIEFGATAHLVTTLISSSSLSPSSNPVLSQEQSQSESFALIHDWLQDAPSLARSIWDPAMTEELDEHIFRFQIMSLQFVNLQLAPSVDLQMKTLLGTQSKQPIFSLQSVDFEPNIQVLGMPGIQVTAESLGIDIEVSGQMKATKDGNGVVGAIAFQTTGVLPPPMRLLPEQILQAASDAINQLVVDFAVANFQKGAKKNFEDFQRKKQATKKRQVEQPDSSIHVQ